MPIFEYAPDSGECERCDGRFEVFQKAHLDTDRRDDGHVHNPSLSQHELRLDRRQKAKIP